MTQILRCKWCEEDPQLIDYHDNEWGKPVTENDALFEALTLEMFQSGLSWRTILHKRENFRNAFDKFQIEKVAAYDTDKIEQLLQDKGIVRHRKKIEATIENAKIAQSLIEQEGSLHNFMKKLPNETIEKQKAIKQTFKHMGLTTAESFLQAAGFTDVDHDTTCFLYKKG